MTALFVPFQNLLRKKFAGGMKKVGEVFVNRNGDVVPLSSNSRCIMSFRKYAMSFENFSMSIAKYSMSFRKAGRRKGAPERKKRSLNYCTPTGNRTRN